MATTDLTVESFEDTVKDGIVLVDFWAGWCAPCRHFAPTYEAQAEKNPDIVFGKVDTEDQQQLAAQFGITSIPTLMAFRDGVLLYNQAGALPEPQLEQLVQAVRDVDMDDVRKKIAEQDSEQDAEK